MVEEEEESKTSLTLEGEEAILVPHTGGVNLNCRFYKDPFPKKDELVVVQVQNVSDMGAYVTLLEYNGVEGMVLMSELSRKRIRSVKRLVRVGRLEVVVVLRVDESRGYIDLSKKRVSPEEIKRCETRFNKSKAVHTILRNVAQITQTNIEVLYESVAWPLYEHFEHPFDAFRLAVTESENVFAGLPMTDEVKRQLTTVIHRRLTPQPVKIRADFDVICYEYEGVEAIRTALMAGLEGNPSECQVSIKLIASPLFVIVVTTANKEKGFETIRAALGRIETVIGTKGGSYQIKDGPNVVDKKNEPTFDEAASSSDSMFESDQDEGDMDVDVEGVNPEQLDEEAKKKEESKEEEEEEDEEA